MSTYLLLRNNKESGPYSLQQLKEMGLKPYDLLWVEGRSAAWRYPGEVEELKSFAPLVEEQPFDRFYKKQEGNKEKHFYEEVEEAAKTEEIKKKETVNIPNERSFTKVFVSLPGQPTVKIPDAPEHKAPEIKRPVTLVTKEDSEEPYQLTEKYSQPFDEIKKQYAETYLKRKKKISRDESMKKMMQVSAPVAFALAIGIFIYIKFKPTETNPGESKTNPVPVASIPVSSNETNTIVKNFQEPENKTTKNELIPEAKINEKAVVLNKEKITEKNEPEFRDEKLAPQRNTVEVQIDKPTGDATTIKKIKPADLASFVSVKANDYKRRAFGGIENLKLTVVNSSNYILDKVTVELHYLKPSEHPLKIETINFTSVSPNGSMTKKIPDSPRGIKILYKIIQVESNQFDKNTAGL